MSFESPVFVQRIETENPKEHEDQLLEQIGSISFMYMEQQCRKDPQWWDMALSDRIQHFTPIKALFLHPINQLGQKINKEQMKEIETILQSFWDEVDMLDEASETDIRKDVFTLLKQHQEQLYTYIHEHIDTSLSEDDAEGHDNAQMKKSGLLQWESKKTLGEGGGSVRALRKEGVTVDDSVIEIHLRPAFLDQQSAISGLRGMEKSFSDLASYIVDHAPETRVIAGSSWLMSTPIAERLGFSVSPHADMGMGHFSTWYQFIDEQGQVNQKRLKQLLETGKLPYENALGYIKVVDFLKRYLSEEQKKKEPIHLKKVIPEKAKDWRRMQMLTASAKSQWDLLVRKNGLVDFDLYLKQNPVIQRIFDVLPQDISSQLEGYFRHAAKKGWTQVELGEYMPASLRDAMNEMNKTFRSTMYEDEIVDLSR